VSVLNLKSTLGVKTSPPTVVKRYIDFVYWTQLSIPLWSVAVIQTLCLQTYRQPLTHNGLNIHFLNRNFMKDISRIALNHCNPVFIYRCNTIDVIAMLLLICTKTMPENYKQIAWNIEVTSRNVWNNKKKNDFNQYQLKLITFYL
jgi:hypothetical protein